ncbi:MAG: HEPN domain-containing protein [Rubrobacteraceae bacterium]|nr:HEPN domain-containing protein [Rubrobacteraceae bacterium]
MSDPEVLKVLRRWLQYAEDDLRAAQILMEQGGVPRTACIHAQQAAEKSLKATFVFLQVDFPFTHDLDRLRELLPQGWDVREDFPDLRQLSIWAIEPRYPGDVIEATSEDAVSAVDQAREIFETTVNELQRRGYQPDDSDTTENA